jgi:hypothetical protein
MSITLSNYLLSFSEKTFSGTFSFAADQGIQIMEVKLFQRIYQKYLIAQINIMSEVGLDKVDFSFPFQSKKISSHLHAKLSAKLQKTADLVNEESCSYELKVQYMQNDKVYVVLFDLVIGD